jgi:hypothetical protein
MNWSRFPTMKCLAVALPVALLVSAPVQAEDTTLEQAFGFGQFSGAATYCGVPRADVLAMAGTLLKGAGIDPDAASPEMKKFTEGVTAGVTAMKATDAPDCDSVKTAFNDARDKLK